MSYLKLKYKKPKIERDKLVGVMLPLQRISYLNLYSLSKGYSKNYLLREMIEEWITKQSAVDSEESLIICFTKQLNHKWQIERLAFTKSKQADEFLNFKEAIKKELSGKLSIDCIEQIIKNLSHDTNK